MDFDLKLMCRMSVIYLWLKKGKIMSEVRTL